MTKEKKSAILNPNKVLKMEGIQMQETKIILKDIQSVRDFVQQVILLDYDVDLAQGRYIVDAKSIMGIFALDILSPVTVQAHTNDASVFFERIKKYII